MSATPPLSSCQSVNSDASEPVEFAYTPTWPTNLQNCVNHVTDQQLPQPDIYLHLSQVLEWEIWTHSQTHAKLVSECMRSAELADQVSRLSSELVHLRKSREIPQHKDKGSSLALQSCLEQERKVCAAKYPSGKDVEIKQTPKPWSYEPFQQNPESIMAAGEGGDVVRHHKGRAITRS